MDKKSRIWVIVLALLLAVALVLLVIFKLRIDRLEAEQPVPAVTQEPATAESTAESVAVDMEALGSRIDGLADTLTEMQQREASLQNQINWIEYELEASDTAESDTTALRDAEKTLGDVSYSMNCMSSAIYSAKNQIATAGSGVTVEQYAAMTEEIEEVETELAEISGDLETVEGDISAVMDDLGFVYPGDDGWQIPTDDEQWNEMIQVLDTVVAERDYYYVEFGAVVRDLEIATAERDTAVAELEIVTAERDTAAAELEIVTAERDTAITDLETVTAERDTAITDLETVTAERDAAIADLETVTAERDAAQEAYEGAAEELEQLRTELDEADSANIALEQQLEETQALLDEYDAGDDTVYHASADMENVVVVASDGVSAEYELVNNDKSGNSIRCEIMIDGEVIYTSGDIAPGGSLEPFELAFALDAGEYDAMIAIVTLNAEGEVSSRISLPATVEVAD